PSPLALRVRRRADSRPAGSTSHNAVTKRVASGERRLTDVTSRVPSGDNVNPPVRGRATKSSREWNGVGDTDCCSVASEVCEVVTALCYHGHLIKLRPDG